MFKTSSIEYATTFGLVNFHFHNMVEAAIQQKNARKLKEVPPPRQLYSYFKHKQQLNEIRSPFSGIAKGKNVFLIHFESLNPNHRFAHRRG